MPKPVPGDDIPEIIVPGYRPPYEPPPGLEPPRPPPPPPVPRPRPPPPPKPAPAPPPPKKPPAPREEPTEDVTVTGKKPPGSAPPIRDVLAPIFFGPYLPRDFEPDPLLDLGLPMLTDEESADLFPIEEVTVTGREEDFVEPVFLPGDDIATLTLAVPLPKRAPKRAPRRVPKKPPPRPRRRPRPPPLPNPAVRKFFLRFAGQLLGRALPMLALPFASRPLNIGEQDRIDAELERLADLRRREEEKFQHELERNVPEPRSDFGSGDIGGLLDPGGAIETIVISAPSFARPQPEPFGSPDLLAQPDLLSPFPIASPVLPRPNPAPAPKPRPKPKPAPVPLTDPLQEPLNEPLLDPFPRALPKPNPSRPGKPRPRPGLPKTPAIPGTLTLPEPNPTPMEELDKCNCEKKKPKKKQKKSRQICYRGTYVEKSKSLTKFRKEQVPCR